MLAQTMRPVVGRTVVLMLMAMSTVVTLSEDSPRSSSALQRLVSSGLSPRPLMGGINERMLNPDRSFASAKDHVS